MLSAILSSVAVIVASAAPLLVGDAAPLAGWESMPAPFIPFMPMGRLAHTRGIQVQTTLTIVGLSGLATPAQLVVVATGVAIHGIGDGGMGMLLRGEMSRRYLILDGEATPARFVRRMKVQK